MKRLAGKKILITGASSGFGRGIALACAAEGADLALVGRNEARLQEVAEQAKAEGCQAVVCIADLADETQVLAAVAKATAAFGQIDVLVNDAGMNVTQRSIKDPGNVDDATFE